MDARERLRQQLHAAIRISGLTQAQISRIGKIPQSSLSRWLSGEVVPTGPSLRKFATALGVSPDLFSRLLREIEEEGAPRPAELGLSELQQALSRIQFDIRELQAWRKSHEQDHSQQQSQRSQLHHP